MSSVTSLDLAVAVHDDDDGVAEALPRRGWGRRLRATTVELRDGPRRELGQGLPPGERGLVRDLDRGLEKAGLLGGTNAASPTFLTVTRTVRLGSFGPQPGSSAVVTATISRSGLAVPVEVVAGGVAGAGGGATAFGAGAAGAGVAAVAGGPAAGGAGALGPAAGGVGAGGATGFAVGAAGAGADPLG